MYLYKATCPNIPTPKQKGGQKERGQGSCSKQNAREKLHPPLVCLRSNSQVELKHLEEFLNVHTLSLQDSVRARTGMAYRYTLRRVHAHQIHSVCLWDFISRFSNSVFVFDIFVYLWLLVLLNFRIFPL